MIIGTLLHLSQTVFSRIRYESFVTLLAAFMNGLDQKSNFEPKILRKYVDINGNL